MATHEIHNQVPALVGYNLFDADRALTEAIEREGAAKPVCVAESIARRYP